MEEKIINISIKEIDKKNLLKDRFLQENNGFIDKSIEVMAMSIKKNGLLNPIRVFKFEEEGSFKYKLINGLRRILAHEYLQRDEIRAIIEEKPTLIEIADKIYEENETREDLNYADQGFTLLKNLACYTVKDPNDFSFFYKTEKELIEIGDSFYKEATDIIIKNKKKFNLNSSELEKLTIYNTFLESKNISLSTLNRRIAITKYGEEIIDLVRKGLNQDLAKKLFEIKKINNNKCIEIINNLNKDREEKMQNGSNIYILKISNEEAKKEISNFLKEESKKKSRNFKSELKKSEKIISNIRRILNIPEDKLESSKKEIRNELLKKISLFYEDIEDINKKIGRAGKIIKKNIKRKHNNEKLY